MQATLDKLVPVKSGYANKFGEKFPTINQAARPMKARPKKRREARPEEQAAASTEDEEVAQAREAALAAEEARLLERGEELAVREAALEKRAEYVERDLEYADAKHADYVALQRLVSDEAGARGPNGIMRRPGLLRKHASRF